MWLEELDLTRVSLDNWLYFLVFENEIGSDPLILVMGL